VTTGRAAVGCALILLAALPAGWGCRGDSARTAAGDDRGSNPRAAPDSRPAHPLTGRWTGHRMTRRWGAVAGVAEIDRDGHGTGVVTASGLTFSAVIEIRSWDGRLLEVAVDGVDYQLHGSLAGDRLVLDLPMVGAVPLERSYNR
jgi:hypothetical protein